MAAFANVLNIGVYGCPGKGLALMQLRIALSRIALNFDLSFGPGETGVPFDTKVMDTFTLTLPKLDVVFKERTRSQI